MTTTEQFALPHSREAEEAVIGSVLINPDILEDVKGIFQKGSQEFYLHRLRFIWDAFERLHSRNIVIDLLTLSEELDDMGRLEEIGGPAYLTALLNEVPSSLHAETYAEMIVAHRVRRDLLTAANEIARLAYSSEMQVEQVCADALGAVTTATNSTTGGTLRSSREVFSSLYDRVDELSRQPADILPGIPTGFIDLDRNYLAGGWKPGQLIYVAARPGNGKTAFLLSCIYQAAYEARKKVALFSLEMDAEDNAERLAAMEQSINTQAISTGKMSGDDWQKFTVAVENGGYAPITFDDAGYLTPGQLRAKCKRIKAQQGLDLVVVDYVGLMSSDQRHENRNQELSYISRSLKQLARELKIPVLAALQMNREVERRGSEEPQLSDLRDSGSFEQDGDMVAFLYQSKDASTGNVTHFKIAKQRKGPTGTVDLLFRKEFTKFENLAPRRLLSTL